MADEYAKENTGTFLYGRLPIYTTVDGFDPKKPEEIIAEVNEATGTWATARLVINDFAFMDTDSACTDFKLSVTSKDEAFAGLNISSVSVKNISHLQ